MSARRPAPRRRLTAAIALAALTLAACGNGDETPDPAAGAGAAPPASSPAIAGLPVPEGQTPPPGQPAPGQTTPDAQTGAGDPRAAIAPENVREIFLAFEGAAGETVSVIFAVDQDRDGEAGDERAIRLSPENGQCNPQELNSYRFTDGTPPVFGIAEAQAGVTPATLPRFLAARVTQSMIERGLASQPDETRGQNVCTRKLWEQIVLNQQEQAASQPSGKALRALDKPRAIH